LIRFLKSNQTGYVMKHHRHVASEPTVTRTKYGRSGLVLATGLMVTEKESDELYRPYDTLKAIGFSADDAKSFLGGIEDAAASQIKSEPKSEPEIAVKHSTQRSERRHSRLTGFLVVVSGFAFAVWLYVVAMQLFYPESIYWPLATWLPIRLDYVGEAAFVFSLFTALAVAMVKVRLKTRRKPPKPNGPSA
jgi:hypothetical protein